MIARELGVTVPLTRTVIEPKFCTTPLLSVALTGTEYVPAGVLSAAPMVYAHSEELPLPAVPITQDDGVMFMPFVSALCKRLLLV